LGEADIFNDNGITSLAVNTLTLVVRGQSKKTGTDTPDDRNSSNKPKPMNIGEGMTTLALEQRLDREYKQDLAALGTKTKRALLLLQEVYKEKLNSNAFDLVINLIEDERKATTFLILRGKRRDHWLRTLCGIFFYS
jgi:hypothetical protein